MLHADTPLAAADIARAAEVAYTPAVSALATLEKRGLAQRTRRAGHDEFEPDKRSAHYPMAYATALVDLPLADALRGQRVYGVYAYGSLAQPGGGSRNSDLDLLIVGDVKDRASMIERLTAVGTRRSLAEAADLDPGSTGHHTFYVATTQTMVKSCFHAPSHASTASLCSTPIRRWRRLTSRAPLRLPAHQPSQAVSR